MDKYKITKDRTVRLPIGIKVGNDIIKEVEIDEWRMIDTTKISSGKNGKAQSDVISRILQVVGDYRKEKKTHMCPPRLVDNMYAADADVILAHSLALANRDKQDIEYQCEKCGGEAVEELSLLELDVHCLSQDDEPFVDFELPRGLEVQTMEGLKVGKRGRYNYPTLRHTRLAAKRGGNSQLEMLCALLLHCVSDFEHSGNISKEDVDMISLEDQDYLFDFLKGVSAGLETEVVSECPHCGHENKLHYDISKCFLSQKR